MTALVASAAFFMPAVWAHADENGNIPPAELANAPPRKDGRESYIQRHMASEHHIGAFDLGSFFSLHDLNRDGVWDVSGRGRPGRGKGKGEKREWTKRIGEW